MPKVKVKTETRYLGPDMKALPDSKKGDVIEVAGGQYLEDLIADGHVTLVDEEAEDSAASAKTKSSPSAPATEPSPGAPAADAAASAAARKSDK